MSVNIAMWSGPRNISTAMMYSFGNRTDCVAWDEPFYAFSLVNHGNDHPMRDEIIAANGSNWDLLVDRCTKPVSKPVFYQKHMTHHMLPGFDRAWIHKMTNAFLIRSPERVLASYARKWADVSLRDIGFVEQAEIFDAVAQRTGAPPAVVDADDILKNPKGVLVALCTVLNIPFDSAMLQWPKGPKTFDGVWAPHWYNAVWESTGFSTQPEKAVELPAALAKIADQARISYLKLKAFSLKAQ
jgi:Sulfotransferase domain